jgi:predicted  nucleic acid-binding Zn-ribbon protein
MISTSGKLAGLALTMLLLSSLWAQRRQDPLNPLEQDQLRDAAQDPAERLKLYIEFSRTRLTSLEKMRVDPKVTDRAQQTRDRLQDFLDVYDELNDNIDTFVERKADLRRPLKTLIEADTEFQAKLRALKSSADANKDEARQYDFLLTSVLDTIDSSVQDHRQLLSEQEEAFKHKKK